MKVNNAQKVLDIKIQTAFQPNFLENSLLIYVETVENNYLDAENSSILFKNTKNRIEVIECRVRHTTIIAMLLIVAAFLITCILDTLEQTPLALAITAIIMLSQ